MNMMHIVQPESLSVKQDFTFEKTKTGVINGIKRAWVSWRVKFTILVIALRCYGSLLKAIKASREFTKFKEAIYGKKQTRRCFKKDGKYYFGLYVPGFPSAIFERYIQTELNHLIPHSRPVNGIQVLQLAITNRCPLRCEHCFEWNNLNKAEASSDEEMKLLINKFQESGCAQFHLTGGEPMIKMKRIKYLLHEARADSEFFILTSGFNVTKENAKQLKAAGVTGVIISLDHFDSSVHNIFRGSAHAYQDAISAANNSKAAGLLTAFSVCLTRSFVTRQNLFTYLELARNCGVAFVQLLEPKAVGHYEGKPVLLSKELLDIVEEFYLAVNFEKAYHNYPVVVYHGFHQRRIGCMSGGKMVMYIDSAGYVDACPFCQTRNHHASEIITGDLKLSNLRISGCPVY